MTTNAEIASLFKELADIMEIAGENHFKIRAYRSAALTIAQMPQDLRDISPKMIIEIPGIGEAISEKIQAALSGGTFPTLEKWRQSSFASFLPLLSLPGMNLRKIRTLIKSYDLKSIDDLKMAILTGKTAGSNAIDVNTSKSLIAFLERMP